MKLWYENNDDRKSKSFNVTFIDSVFEMYPFQIFMYVVVDDYTNAYANQEQQSSFYSLFIAC